MNYVIPEEVIQLLKKKSQVGEDSPACIVSVRSVATGNVWREVDRIKGLNVSRRVGDADTATITMDNAGGIYSPEPDSVTGWELVFTPNTEVNITLGYGSNQVQYFRGYIDNVDITSYPAEISIDCRSKYKLALDNIIHLDAGSGVVYHTLIYRNETIEDIFVDLALKAGWTEGQIFIEEDPDYRTGITLEEFEVSWETYADAFTRLSEISQFEIICDEYGDLHLSYPTMSQPAIVNQEITFDTGIKYLFGVKNIIEGSEFVQSTDKTITYTPGVDYDISYDEANACIAIYTLAGSSIPYGATVLLSYVYPAFSFIEGETITGVSYSLSDDEAYSEVYVYGDKQTIVTDEYGNEQIESEVIEGRANYNTLGMNYYGDTILKLSNMPHKVLKIDSSIAQTVEQCNILAERALRMCNKRYRNCRHTAVAVPYLILGDSIQVYEKTSGISEAYRIVGTDIQLDGSGFIMDVESYHVGAFKVLGPGGV